MTVIDAETPTVEAENEESTVTESKRGRAADRDFTKFAQRHQEIADYVNENSGLTPLTPNHIKAVQLLSGDYRDTPEQKQARDARAAERKNEEKEFAGLDADEKKELRAANRKKKALEEVEARRQELLDKAKAIRESAEASGEDLAAAVNSEASSGQQEPGKRRIGSRK